MKLLLPNPSMQRLLPPIHADVHPIHDNEWMKTGIKWPCHIKRTGREPGHKWCFMVICMCVCVCVPYLEGEPVLAGAEPHVLHGGAVDHHLSHISAGHKHWAAGLTKEKKLCD